MRTNPPDIAIPVRRLDVWVAAGIATAVVLGAGLVTAWGPCFDDPGELQTAAAVMGIAHSPGYAGYMLVGRVICLIPGIEPAALISGANLVAGALSLSILYLIQRVGGVQIVAAVTAVTAVAFCDRFFMSVTAPEVYAPSLLLVSLAAYCGLLWAQRGHRVWLVSSALLMGFLAANRPSAILMVPAFIVFVGVVGRGRRKVFGDVLAAMGIGLVPVLVCLGYVLWRDTPDTAFNYLENYDRRIAPLVGADGEALGRLDRALWLMSGREHGEHVVDSWRQFAVRLEYLREEFGYGGRVGFVVGAGVVALGAIRMWGRDIAATLLIGGIALGNAAFYCAYVAYGTEAYILPALLAVGCLAGHGLTRVFEGMGNRPIRVAAAVVMAGGLVYSSSDEDWFQNCSAMDASAFVAAADIGTLPEGPLILGTDQRVSPLQYCAVVRHPGREVEVQLATESSIAGVIAALASGQGQRTVYCVDRYDVPEGYWLKPERNLYRVMRGSERTASAMGSAKGI